MALVSLDGRWIKVNKSLCDLVGYTEDELLKIDFQSITHEDDLERDLDYAMQLVNNEITSYQIEKRYYTKEGKITWILLTVSLVKDEQEHPLYFFSQIQDINKQKKAESELVYLASHDSLTGLINRYQLEKKLKELLSNKFKKKSFAIIFLDLDNFKQINDTLGHIQGDKVLVEVANRLVKASSKETLIARFGGDEFVIVTTSLDVTPIAEKILFEMKRPYKINKEAIYMGASMGIACYPESGNTLTKLLQNADLALLQAKEEGGGIYEFFSDEMGKMKQEKFLLEKALHEAVHNHEFFLMYQPKFDLSTKKLVGIEALVRWQHPKLGLIMPDQFIPIAEKSGLIVSVGQWVLEAACQQFTKWRGFLLKHPHFTIAINLSPRQLKDKNFIANIKNLMLTLDVPSKNIELELTEHAVMRHEKDDVIFNHLDDLAIQLVIDDFGIGYSSLERLKKLPITSLKIDRSFVLGLESGEGNAAIIKSIITLGKELGVNVIAEGIETESHYDFLLEHGCPHGQGHFLSKPLLHNEITLLLHAHLT